MVSGLLYRSFKELGGAVTTPRWFKILFTLSLSGMLTLVIACAREGALDQPVQTNDGKAQSRLSNEPTESLVATRPMVPRKRQSEIYEPIEAKIAVDMSQRKINARVFVRSSAGIETVDLTGEIQPDASATLLDIQPISKTQNRLIATAYCPDKDACKNVILNVHYKVNSQSFKRQFASRPLVEPKESDEESEESEKPEDTNKDANNNSPNSSENNSNSETASDAVPSETQSNKGKKEKDEEIFDHGEQNPEDPNNELVGRDQMAEFVGAPLNEEIAAQIWDRPEKPQPIPPPVKSEKLPVEEPTGMTENKDDKRVNSKSGTDAKAGTGANSKSDSTSGPAPTTSAPTSPSSPPSQGETSQQPDPEQKITPTSAPSAPQQDPVNPTPTTQPPEAQAPAQVPTTEPQPRSVSLPQPQPRPQVPQKKSEKTKTAPQDRPKSVVPISMTAQTGAPGEANPDQQRIPSQPPASAASTSSAPSPSRTEAKERELAPFMNLIEGGRAVGPHFTIYSKSKKNGKKRIADQGSLEDASPMPEEGNAFNQLHTGRETHWGTGMMITLLVNATDYFKTKYYPDTTIFIGDIARRKGGDFGAHNSHQSGLDADIPYFDNPGFPKVTNGKGGVKPSFDFAKHWQFFRLVASQKIIRDGETTTALNRIFVNPAIKKGFCAWAKKHDLLKDPFDARIMMRLRATSGHDKHFHLRLKCSPHYPECQDQVEPPETTEC